ncbi:Alpha/Beta hydrolase protein [Aspergillus aurantiobrunneus]
MLIGVRFLLLIPCLLGQTIALVDSQRSSASVDIRNGTVIGVNDESSQVQRVLGIPYAQPPVGDLRLRHAVPLNAFFGTLNAQSFGPACYGPELDSNPDSSEDCLSLNIWRPSGQIEVDALRPVLVWFYGGGLQNGYTVRDCCYTTQMRPLPSRNYRLGPLGLLNGQQMANLELLNLGMLDQRRALHWIQENIAAFGGDPNKVTISGESAGAVSVYSHLMAYGGRDDRLFRAGILESGGAFPLTYANTSSFQETFDSLITDTSCTSFANASAAEQLSCIRQLPVQDFLSSVGSNTGQSIDGSFTETSIHFALPAEKYVKVPMIVGTNTDEGTNSAPMRINTTEQLSVPLADGFHRPTPLPNSTVSTLLSLYPDDPRRGYKKACSIFGDIVQIGPARMIAQWLTRNNRDNKSPEYRYRFNHLPHDTDASNIAAGIGTGIEQRYVFSNLVPDHPWDRSLAYEISSAWVPFAYGLDPDPGGESTLPEWPEYGTSGKSMVFRGCGSSIEEDTYRAESVDYIIENVLPYGAL